MPAENARDLVETRCADSAHGAAWVVAQGDERGAELGPPRRAEPLHYRGQRERAVLRAHWVASAVLLRGRRRGGGSGARLGARLRALPTPILPPPDSPPRHPPHPCRRRRGGGGERHPREAAQQRRARLCVRRALLLLVEARVNDDVGVHRDGGEGDEESAEVLERGGAHPLAVVRDEGDHAADERVQALVRRHGARDRDDRLGARATHGELLVTRELAKGREKTLHRGLVAHRLARLMHREAHRFADPKLWVLRERNNLRRDELAAQVLAHRGGERVEEARAGDAEILALRLMRQLQRNREHVLSIRGEEDLRELHHTLRRRRPHVDDRVHQKRAHDRQERAQRDGVARVAAALREECSERRHLQREVLPHQVRVVLHYVRDQRQEVLQRRSDARGARRRRDLLDVHEALQLNL